MDNITASQLLSLRTGARLRVKKKIKKEETELIVQLLDTPRLEPIGKPGLHRVRMQVCGGLLGSVSMFSTQRGRLVTGAEVIEIL